jgi:2-octaprenyl-6-methoxyphenol hydroxylase
VLLVEAVAPDASEQPSFDERTTALANGSVRTFRTLGAWRDMERDATPIRRLHVSDQGRFGVARIDAAEQGLAALGYVVPNWAIGRALRSALDRVSGSKSAPARVVASEAAGDRRGIVVETGDQQRSITARLVVAADGRALGAARAGGHRCRSLGLRTDRDRHDGGNAALSRPRGVRAVHA